jgi:hypothetical protein
MSIYATVEFAKETENVSIRDRVSGSPCLDTVTNEPIEGITYPSKKSVIFAADTESGVGHVTISGYIAGKLHDDPYDLQGPHAAITFPK